MSESLWLIHIIATAIMTAVIWIVQVIQYPSFSRLKEECFVEHHRQHSSRIALIVGPAMLVELVTGMMLFSTSVNTTRILMGFALALTGAIWASTALIQVPCHNRLSRGFDASVHRRLVHSNWIRTIAWSIRLVLVSWAHLVWTT